MKRSTIDIGSNSVLLLAGSLDGETILEELNESRITSLGKNLDKTGVFDQQSMENTFIALKEYREMLISGKYNIEETIVTATEASRVAKNATDFFNRIKNDLGFRVQIISASGEAFFTALGVATSLKMINSAVIMDIGGASTELIKIKMSPNFQLISSVSLPIGSVRASDWILDNSHENKWKSLVDQFSLKEYETDNLICVAGSMTSLAAIFYQQDQFDANSLDGKIIDKEIFLKFLNKLTSEKPEKLLSLYPYLGKRVHSLAGGTYVAGNFIEKVCRQNIMISTRGLRYGTFIAGGIDGKYRVN